MTTVDTMVVVKGSKAGFASSIQYRVSSTEFRVSSFELEKKKKGRCANADRCKTVKRRRKWVQVTLRRKEAQRGEIRPNWSSDVTSSDSDGEGVTSGEWRIAIHRSL